MTSNRFAIALGLALALTGAGFAQGQPFTVTIGPEGQVSTSFERGDETFILEGDDSIDFMSENGDGVLHFETLVTDTSLEPIVDLDAFIEPTGLERTGEPFTDPLDPRFTGDFYAILTSFGLIVHDVYDVVFDRIEGQPLVVIAEVGDIDQSSDPGTVFIGDLIGDFFNVDVLSGRVNGSIVVSTSTTPRFADTLTIQTFASPPPTGTTITLGSEGQVLTLFERGEQTFTLEGNDSMDFVSENGEEGVLHIESIVHDRLLEPIIDLETLFEQTAIAPTGQAFNGPLDPRFTRDFDATLAANSLDRFDVSGILFNRVERQPLVEIVDIRGLYVTEDTGTVWIGDVDNDFFNIDVITGLLNGLIRVFTFTTQAFEDTLTIQLFAGAEPMPGINLDLCPPPDGDGRIDACDLILLIEAMQGGTVSQQELFEVSRDWLDEEPFGGNRR
ncbi:MAG: hypothetical protein KC964_13000 [Candidatus Omnitrophica bacterium]|nr:hypothetical protein [Candidatus Omnitrophota bacterium]